MELLEFHRRCKGMTQQQAAKSVRAKSASTWNQWEKSGRLPADEFLPRVASFCGMTTEQFLCKLRPDLKKFC